MSDLSEISHGAHALTFTKHAFAAKCFNTKGCRVLYAGRYAVNDAETVVSPPPRVGQIERMHGFHIGLRNFPEPAIVEWRSMDGEMHHVSIDMAKIFIGSRIVHNAPSDLIKYENDIDHPDILLVVDDSVVKVYMKAFIPLKSPVDPKNRDSDFVSDVVLAYEESF